MINLCKLIVFTATMFLISTTASAANVSGHWICDIFNSYGKCVHWRWIPGQSQNLPPPVVVVPSPIPVVQPAPVMVVRPIYPPLFYPAPPVRFVFGSYGGYHYHGHHHYHH